MKSPIYSRLKRVVTFVGTTTFAIGITTATAMAAVIPPDMFGFVPNYATSPLPVVNSTPVLSIIGNGISTDQPYATDYPPIADPTVDFAPVMVVLPSAVLPAGNLQSFSTWNQATAGLSPTPSAGDPALGTNGKLYAYVLRPTGVANEYTVVYQSGQLQVPAVAVAGISEVMTFPVSPAVAVQAGDVIGFYGEGVPILTGSGTDILSYPAPVAPAAGGTFTLGATDFPIIAQARTYSIAATVDTGTATTTISGGMRKFVDTLPQLDTPNNLGQSLTVAVPDTTTYPGSDYYEIEYGEFTKQMHSDLPQTRLRGYHQVNLPAGTTDPGFQYLGTVILAQKDRPVRVKYINNLPIGAGGDLFIPTDTTYMGAGDFEVSSDLNDPNSPTITGTWTQNRSTTHLHGGATPWISDGTPHQWTTPAGEFATPQVGVSYGDSKEDVPDMWFDAGGNTIVSCAGQLTCDVAGATNDPGPGANTMYYTNQQSARLMFYHDHALGLTRLNVYAGMAGGYLETDPTEQTLINGGEISATLNRVATP